LWFVHAQEVAAETVAEAAAATAEATMNPATATIPCIQRQTVVKLVVVTAAKRKDAVKVRVGRMRVVEGGRRRGARKWRRGVGGRRGRY
jgi:hypothetical protein